MRPSAFLVALLVAVALAGCGGEARLSKREYEQKVRTVYAGVQEAFRATDVQEGLGEKVAAAQEELRDAADELDAVEPPSEVARHHEEIVDGLREYAEDLDELRNAIAAGDRERVRAFNENVAGNLAVYQIAEAAEEMKFMGYDLGPIAEE